ncbi:MAG: Stp1/IreP family PP2C-type Ser/Thr phosphatase [Clostridia bacterium]|jgi:protein phosphatase|nr:Stp1/IreP family PP2C-type Ser/Thr phosphatase [Clostridia bacterium]
MIFNYASYTDIGQVRENNEDYHIVIPFEEYNEFAAAVADGMGGHLFGEIASKAAIDCFEKKIRDRRFKNCNNIKEYLFSICKIANKDILEFSKKHNVFSGMGTTLDAIYIKDDKLHIIHIGDSRIYSVYNNEIKMITKDHSYVQQLLDKGDITIDEYQNHPNKNVITKALGIADIPEPDIFDVTLDFCGYLLLCTDGLTNMLDDTDILNIINQETDLEGKVRELAKKANENGGTDNITIILIKTDRKLEE